MEKRNDLPQYTKGRKLKTNYYYRIEAILKYYFGFDR